jgi:diguanylate cyclase (GGDEF)-like protein
MQETLYDRFRPFKPYDLVLALSTLVLVAPSTNTSLSPVERALSLFGGLAIYFLLDALQRLVRVPTPRWQATVMVGASTITVAALIYLYGAYQYNLPFAILNTTFATVAFGQLSGLVTALVSVTVLSQLSALPGAEATAPVVWMLYLVVLLTLVAILTRVNRLQQDALYDAVTGLRNHRYFQVRLREEIQRSERSGVPTALIVLDLDNFKRVNDQFGHARGDEVLHQVSDALVRNARGTDIVCRYGGEELAVILPGTPLGVAVQVAERLRRAVAEASAGKGTPVTLSAGVATFPEHAAQVDNLIAAADAAMYRAKEAGKDRVVSAESQAAAARPAVP